MHEDKQIVTRSMIILFLALTIVYSLVYMRKSEVFKASRIPPTSLTGSERVDTWPSLPVPVVKQPTTTGESTMQSQGSQNVASGGTNASNGVNLSNITQSSVTSTQNPGWVDLSALNNSLASTTSRTSLSGTSQYFGVLDIVDVLGSQPEYILMDNQGNYFVYYGRNGLDFVRTVQLLGGNVYVMATESEILQNQLFGDKVSFINLQAYKDRLVLMVIEIEGSTRLLQVPANRYHSSKSYLKSLFIY